MRMSPSMKGKVSRAKGRGVRGARGSTRRKHPSRTAAAAPRRSWTARVMRTSNALDLEPGVFTYRSPRAIASSLRRSALQSQRRKSEPYRSAMSMLSFHINRSGRTLTPARRQVLERAKVELRRLFGRAR